MGSPSWYCFAVTNEKVETTFIAPKANWRASYKLTEKQEKCDPHEIIINTDLSQERSNEKEKCSYCG